MKIFFRTFILFALLSQFVYAQNGGGGTQPATNGTSQTPVGSNSPRNAPSTTGFIQSAISQGAAALGVFGLNPTSISSLLGGATTGGSTPGVTTPIVTTPAVTVPTTTVTTAPVYLYDTVKQLYVDTVKLPKSQLFGYDLFRNKSILMYTKTIDGRARGNYVLGIGDQIGINIWGYSSFSGSFPVDETGAIYPQGPGKIYVKGMTLEDATSLIRSRFGSFLDMNNSQLEVTILYSRNLNVNIVGEVFTPGTFNIPATNTVFNALIASGGPTDQGSIRKIYVKRQGQTIKTLDVYQFLLNPESNQDFFLQDNDYVFVPPIGKVVSVTGEIRRPYKYELIEGEDLNSLITYAGGLTPYSYTKDVTIKRYVNQKLTLIDVNLDSLMKVKGKFELLDGDEVSISTIPNQLFKFVRVSGDVMQPGDYTYSDGMHVSDLLKKAHGLKEDALTSRAYIVRKNEDLTSSYLPFIPQNVLDNPNSADNLKLNNLDEVYFYDKASFVDELTVAVSGAVRLPGNYVYAKGMTLNDLLLTAGGIQPSGANTRIEILRYQPSPNGGIPQPEIIKTVPIGQDLSIAESDGQFSLEPFDNVYVRALIDYATQGVITIKGEVMYPGKYSLKDKNEKLDDVIAEAGGITPWGDASLGTLTREENNRGYIFMKLDEALADANSKYNFILRSGDEITVPLKTDIVTISGLIKYPYADTLGFINAPYTQGKRAKYYIKNYGTGFQKDVHRGRTYVIQPGKIVEDPRHWGFIQIYPKVQKGAYVVVPYIKEEENLKVPAAPVDVNAVIESAMIKISGILTLAVLVSRIGTF